MRSGLWNPQRRVERSAFATMREVFGDHCRLTTPLPEDAVMRVEPAAEL